MARTKNLIDGHRHRLPFFTAAAKASHRLLVIGALARWRGDHMRDGLTVPGNRHGLSAFDHPKEIGQTRFGLGSLNRSHSESNLSK